MALRFMDSFQAADIVRKGWVSTSLGNANVIGGVHPYGGVNVLFADNTNHGVARNIFPSAKTIVGVTVGASNTFGGGAVNGGIRIGNGSDAVGVIWAGATSMQLIRNSTVLTGGTCTFPAVGQWQRHEMQITFHPSAGTVLYKVDGVTIFDYTGNTSTAANPGVNAYLYGNTNTRMYYFDFVHQDGIDGTTLTPPQNAAYDAMLGDLRMTVHSPTGPGSVAQWTPSTGANYAAVDEMPVSDTDYVASGTSGQRDLYAFSDRLNAGTILGVAVNSHTNKDDAGAISMRHVAKSAAASVVGADIPVNAGVLVLQSILCKDPNTSAAWTEAAFNAAEFGYEVV